MIWQDSLQKLLAEPSEIFWTDDFTDDGVKAMFYRGAPWQGKETRVFAWYGTPENASPENPVPAVVLIHGGGGTALADWVRLWNKKGYAAIAMDTCGGIPVWSCSPYYKLRWPRHAYSGPAGWGNMQDSGLPPEEQWMFHAIYAVLRGYKILKDFPEVDSGKIGVTGISWGGILCCSCSGLEPGFRFSIPVYGCGLFNREDSKLIQGTSEEQVKQWFELWDPAHLLKNTQMPTLFFNDTEDFAFPTDMWMESTNLVKSMVRRSLRINYPHNHVSCWESKTIFNFADAVLNQQTLPDFGNYTISDNMQAEIEVLLNGRNLVSAELYATRASGWHCDRRWNGYPASFQDGKLSSQIPEGTKEFFWGFYDEQGCFWSSPVVEFAR